MFKIVRFLSLPNLSNQIIAKSNGGLKITTKTDKTSERTSGVFVSFRSLAVTSNFDESFENFKSMLTSEKFAFAMIKGFLIDC